MVNYVKFIRCTRNYYNNLTTKDQDTLYFVYNQNSTDNGFLYLGNRLISGSEEYDTGYISINDVKDILIRENITDNDILLYNEGLKKWENHPLQDLLSASAMVGATDITDGIAGLVPQPKQGDQLNFLRGDGTWQFIDTYDDELHAIANTLVATDNGMSVREIAQDVTASLSGRIGNLEEILNGASSGSDLGLRTRVMDLEISMGDFQPRSPVYLDVGEAITYLDNSVTELNDRLRWHKFKEENG